ncbi:MAG: DUF3575 domain-containing protein [Tannerellaceae bacterium]|nr:DUF3575 domain-containing protein [Tannerellaceae bacterium]MCD8263443.1 DUF3575 domain-containing protein [Tannerellaceae bacterium]
MRKVLYLLLLIPALLKAESPLNPITVPNWGIKTNFVYWATTTPNLGFEIATGKKNTLDISGGYNPFTFHHGTKFKHALIQPEFRWWFCEKFNGSFVGVHAHYARFNVGRIDMPFSMFPDLKTHRYQGNLYGGGVSYGYQWILGKHWNLEASLGVGYAYIDYDKYECGDCGKKIKDDHTHYFGITRATLSIIYVIK